MAKGEWYHITKSQWKNPHQPTPYRHSWLQLEGVERLRANGYTVEPCSCPELIETGREKEKEDVSIT